jgi:2-iminobutanoate/2-iminopropanoate deaminase
MPRSPRVADAPQAIGPYSQAIVSPPFVFVSGCLGFDPKTGAFIEGGVEAQTHQALKNLKSVIEASGSEVGKVVKTTVRCQRFAVTKMDLVGGIDQVT